MSNPELTRLRAAENAFEVAIRAMGQALVDASAAAHEIAELDPPKDEQDADYDRLLWLGKITDGLGVLCTPRLRILTPPPRACLTRKTTAQPWHVPLLIPGHPLDVALAAVESALVMHLQDALDGRSGMGRLRGTLRRPVGE